MLIKRLLKRTKSLTRCTSIEVNVLEVFGKQSKTKLEPLILYSNTELYSI